jgi:cobalt-precorrin-5B (C1)-methyltransferase
MLTSISITLPTKKTSSVAKEVSLEVSVESLSKSEAKAYTVKDAGDDPDVTHGATIFVTVTLLSVPEVVFKADKGVGTVTRDGLTLAVGEPAINPVPRQMIKEHLTKLAQFHEYEGGFEVAVGVENGEAIALKTMNPKLGIFGGLSILGTTGIVRPFSCAAWIASIHQGIDVATVNGLKHIAATTGNTSEQAIKAKYPEETCESGMVHMTRSDMALSDMALIEMGDFAGAVLKHLRKLGDEGCASLQKVTLCGGFGKITKLANGHMDLNSRVSAIDLPHIAAVAKSVGADEALQQYIRDANTTIQALNLCKDKGIPLADAICSLAHQKAREYIPSSVQLDVWAIDRKGNFVGCCLDDQTSSNQALTHD